MALFQVTQRFIQEPKGYIIRNNKQAMEALRLGNFSECHTLLKQAQFVLSQP
jgi:hypothetical protein